MLIQFKDYARSEKIAVNPEDVSSVADLPAITNTRGETVPRRTLISMHNSSDFQGMGGRGREFLVAESYRTVISRFRRAGVDVK